jgi:acetyl-CoA carboxylase carboxyl transferase subunit alpha
MRLAEKFHLPIVTFINTPGAYPGIGAEERGQAWAIAENLRAMAGLKVPIVCLVIGEGGSGGALGIGLGDRILMLEHAYYSVISPEGCAAILWGDAKRMADAAKALKLTARDLKRLGIIDEVLDEPVGGAHRNPAEMFKRVRERIDHHFTELSRLSTEKLIESRYEKFRRMGSVFAPPPEIAVAEKPASGPPPQAKP